ncbi:Lysozyme [Aphelenchoides fujianensis]|nr:Lysozyme [Aphelenchoides fujianensis]
MFEKLRLFAFAGLLLINSGAVNGDCLSAICNADLSCGYFQIQSDYYTDCGTPNFDGDFERSWKNCADDYVCASQCVQNYFYRYNRMCSNVADECEKMARLHNGGPNGCQNPATVDYWNRVQAHLMFGAVKFFVCVTVWSMLISTNAADDACLLAICDVESSCRPIGCKMDVGSLSCGYFQIKLAYYKDCDQPDFNGDLEQSWKKCADDYECASRCVQKYYNRYRHKCSEVDDECEKMSRLHNGGPAGCQKSATVSYWNRVKSRLGSSSASSRPQECRSAF